MDEQFAFLRTVVTRLEAAGIPYMLTGSLALAVWARPRMTRDIDLIIAADGPQVSALLAAFADDCYASAEAAHEAFAAGTMFNAIHLESLLKADFIFLQATPYEQAKFGRRRAVDLGAGFSVAVISPEDLILSKLQWAAATASARQEDDVRLLLHDVEGLDRDYLRKWAGALHLQDVLARLEL